MISVHTPAPPSSAPRRLGRSAWLIPAVLTVIVLGWELLPFWSLRPIGRDFIDLQVYRLGVHAWWHGADMYGSLPKTSIGVKLPFIYPPFAALALSPFAMLPMFASTLAYLAVSITVLALIIHLVARQFWRAGTGLTLWVTACALPLAVLIEPVRSTLDFGQVNLVLLALVAADCLVVRPKWKRGMLIGLAAAIKLTPAAFVLYFLVRRDYRAAATAAITGAVASILAYAVMPGESTRYWFGGMGNVSDLSGSAFRTNQSIQGVLARLQVPQPEFTVLWLVLSLALLALAVAGMRRAADNPALAMSWNAVFTLLASPISWSHHWVWIAPALLAAIGTATQVPRHQAKTWYGLITVAAIVFAIGPHNLLPGNEGREVGWAPWQHVIGDSFVWFSVLALALYVRSVPKPQQRDPVAPDAVRERLTRTFSRSPAPADVEPARS